MQRVKPWEFAKTVPKVVGSAIALPVIGESVYNTGKNWGQGNYAPGGPVNTGKYLANGVTFMSDMTGVGPGIAAASHKGINDVFDANPNIQSTLQNLSKTTGNLSQVTGAISDAVADPSKRQATQQFIGDTMYNTAGQVIGSAGKTLGKGVLEGMGEAVVKHPLETIGSSVALGAGPVVAYDMMQKRKKNREEATNNAILRYILRNEKKMNKTAGVPSTLWKYFQKARTVDPFLEGGWTDKIMSKLPAGAARNMVYQNTIPTPRTEIGADVILRMQSAMNAGKPYAELETKLFGHYPQTLVNNTLTRAPGYITRNPYRSMFGATAGLGAASGIAETAHSAATDPNTSALDTIKNVASRTAQGATMIPAIEFAGLTQNAKYDELRKSPTIQQLGTIKDNLGNILSNSGSIKRNAIDPMLRETSDVAKQTMKQLGAASGQTLESTAKTLSDPNKLNQANTKPEPSSLNKLMTWMSDQKNKPEVLMPAAGLAIGAPILAHGVYKRYGQSDLNETRRKNELMRRQIEELDNG